MLQIVLAPCSPFSVSSDLMRQSAALARQYGVYLHTHLAETQDEEAFCLAKFGYRPVGYMQSLDWTGPDVWFAHSVHVNPSEIGIIAKTGCGVAHCPTSNMRLASGIAPLREYLRVGIKVGLGVDGSASNDSSHMLAEARQAMLLARLREGMEGASLSFNPPGARNPDPNGIESNGLLTARRVLELATLGGAAVLGRKDIGALKVGCCADFFAINLNRLDYAGALVDPVAAVVFCAPQKVDYNVVHGRVIVARGQLLTVDVPELVNRHNRAAYRLLSGDE